MKLSFRDLKQNKFTIEAEPTDLISEVKQRIATEKGWDASTQKLIYSGKILQDANTVESYKIEEKGFIVCMTAKPKVTAAASTSASASSSTTKTIKPATASTSNQTTSSNNDDPVSTNPSASSTAASSNTAFTDLTNEVAADIRSRGIAMGAERNAQISELEKMGFERPQILAAMRAAYYNSERAVEYLLNGIPENLQSAGTSSSTTSATLAPPPASAPTITPNSDTEGVSRNLFDAAAELGASAAGVGGTARSTSTNAPSGANLGSLGSLDFLRNNPQFQQLRQVVQQQPHMLEPILQQVGAGNPQLAALIGDHSQQFLQLLSEDADSDAPLPPGAQAINVTEDERAAIERLCHLGFSRDLAIQAYFACDKNEELAANFLFEQPDLDEQ